MSGLPTAHWGAGVDVVLIHGAAGYKEAWGPLPQALARDGLGVLAVDLPGGAHRPGLGRPGPVSCERHARALGALLDRVGPVCLVGHSLGAGTALMVARLRPHLVTGAVLLAPVVAPRRLGWHRPGPLEVLALPVVGPALARPVLAALRRRPEWRLRTLVGAVGAPQELAAGTPAWRLAHEAADRLAGMDLASFLSWASSALRRGAHDVAPWVGPPCLLVAGGRDPLAAPAAARALCGLLPHGRLVTLPRVGHFPHLEDEATVAALVREHARAGWGRPREDRD